MGNIHENQQFVMQSLHRLEMEGKTPITEAQRLAIADELERTKPYYSELMSKLGLEKQASFGIQIPTNTEELRIARTTLEGIRNAINLIPPNMPTPTLSESITGSLAEHEVSMHIAPAETRTNEEL